MPPRFTLFPSNLRRRKKEPTVKFARVDESDLHKNLIPEGKRPATANKTNEEREKHPRFYSQNRHDNRLYNVTYENLIGDEHTTQRHWNELFNSEKYIEILRAHQKREIKFENSNISNPVNNRFEYLEQANPLHTEINDLDFPVQSITRRNMFTTDRVPDYNYSFFHDLALDTRIHESPQPVETLLDQDNYFQ